ncbi:hypothetical protein [Roseomonas harenae]|jgi:hypothetical protein|uniref:hypothetical protein n=1 Tax=Muricoccus harenae TaxID=2692566 RepID=UPI001331604B|nr:hypothetical protein [Roseomonas harenae]
MTAVSTYSVRLVDCARTRQGKEQGGLGTHASGVCTLLKKWYTSVCQKASSGNQVWNADVQWQAVPSSAPAGESAGAALTVNLILFFIPIPRDSVILSHPNYSNGFTLPSIMDHSLGGVTVVGGTRRGNQRTPTLGISEIYVDRLQERNAAETPLTIARLAFHEGMHNQLDTWNNNLHAQGGFAAAIPVGTDPTIANINAMAARIGNLVPQWTGGFQAWLDWDKNRPR